MRPRIRLTNTAHLAAFVLDSFLLPISIVGMAQLAMRGSPRLPTIGGALGLVGWLPFSALTAPEDLTLQMAQLGANDLLGALWERFNNDPAMTLFLVVYIAGHLLAYVVLTLHNRGSTISRRSLNLHLSTVARFATRLGFP